MSIAVFSFKRRAVCNGFVPRLYWRFEARKERLPVNASVDARYGARLGDSVVNDAVFFVSWIIVGCNMINGFHNAALIDGNINNDGTRFHLFNHFFRNESRRFGS